MKLVIKFERVLFNKGFTITYGGAKLCNYQQF